MIHFVPIRFYKESSEEERDHAEKLMKYQVLNSHQEDYVVPFFFFFWVLVLKYLIYYDFFAEHTRWKSKITLYNKSPVRI